jgi:hypothetical protein
MNSDIKIASPYFEINFKEYLEAILNRPTLSDIKEYCSGITVSYDPSPSDVLLEYIQFGKFSGPYDVQNVLVEFRPLFEEHAKKIGTFENWK